MFEESRDLRQSIECLELGADRSFQRWHVSELRQQVFASLARWLFSNIFRGGTIASRLLAFRAIHHIECGTFPSAVMDAAPVTVVSDMDCMLADYAIS